MLAQMLKQEPKEEAEKPAVDKVTEFRDPISRRKVSPADAARVLADLDRKMVREAVKYAAGGMWDPRAYDKAHAEFAGYCGWYYSDSGPGGVALLAWLERQSIYHEQ
jgi:hypothetical protein